MCIFPTSLRLLGIPMLVMMGVVGLAAVLYVGGARVVQRVQQAGAEGIWFSACLTFGLVLGVDRSMTTLRNAFNGRYGGFFGFALDVRVLVEFAHLVGAVIALLEASVRLGAKLLSRAEVEYFLPLEDEPSSFDCLLM